MKNRIATRILKKMVLQHSRDLFGMKNLVTTLILPLGSITMEILVSMQICYVSFALSLFWNMLDIYFGKELLQILCCCGIFLLPFIILCLLQAFTTIVTLEFGIPTINKLNNMFLAMTKTILKQLGLWPMKTQRPQIVILAKML
jgi:hypothetical protein